MKVICRSIMVESPWPWLRELEGAKPRGARKPEGTRMRPPQKSAGGVTTSQEMRRVERNMI